MDTSAAPTNPVSRYRHHHLPLGEGRMRGTIAIGIAIQTDLESEQGDARMPIRRETSSSPMYLAGGCKGQIYFTSNNATNSI
jgi:hypothetical protein